MALKGMTWKDLDNLKIDEDGQLHWKDGKVSIEKKVSLRGYELFLATIAAIGALLAGIHPFLVSLKFL